MHRRSATRAALTTALIPLHQCPVMVAKWRYYDTHLTHCTSVLCLVTLGLDQSPQTVDWSAVPTVWISRLELHGLVSCPYC